MKSAIYKRKGLLHYKKNNRTPGSRSHICRTKTRNIALDVVCGIETIILPLPRQPQTKSFCPANLLPRAKSSLSLFNAAPFIN